MRRSSGVDGLPFRMGCYRTSSSYPFGKRIEFTSIKMTSIQRMKWHAFGAWCFIWLHKSIYERELRVSGIALVKLKCICTIDWITLEWNEHVVSGNKKGVSAKCLYLMFRPLCAYDSLSLSLRVCLKINLLLKAGLVLFVAVIFVMNHESLKVTTLLKWFNSFRVMPITFCHW